MSDPAGPTTAVEESFFFSSRLLFSYVMAALAFMATGHSVWIGVVATAAWLVSVVRLLIRFGFRGALSLLSSPFALYWLFQAFRPPAVSGEIYL